MMFSTTPLTDVTETAMKPTLQARWRRIAAVLVLALTAAAALYQFQRSKTHDTEIVVRLGQMEVRGLPASAGAFAPLFTREQLTGLTLRLVDPDGNTTLRTVFDFETSGAPIQVSTGRVSLPPRKYTTVLVGTFATAGGATMTRQWSLPTDVAGDGTLELTP